MFQLGSWRLDKLWPPLLRGEIQTSEVHPQHPGEEDPGENLLQSIMPFILFTNTSWKPQTLQDLLLLTASGDSCTQGVCKIDGVSRTLYRFRDTNDFLSIFYVYGFTNRTFLQKYLSLWQKPDWTTKREGIERNYGLNINLKHSWWICLEWLMWGYRIQNLE